MGECWITGDIHGDPNRLSNVHFPEQKEFEGGQDENFVIICGDFGLVWHYAGENKNERYWLNWLEERPFTTLFVDGNHENHKRLAEYPIEEWHGGKVHKIRPHVIHLMRGEVYEILGKRFFTFGGASSHDIKDGILDIDDPDYKDKKKELDKNPFTLYRVRNVSWWDAELPSEEEMENGRFNLEKHDWKVDFVITHSPSASVIALLGGGLYEQDILTKYLEEIRIKLNYKRHFAGHMHVNRAVNTQDLIIYEQIIRIA